MTETVSVVIATRNRLALLQQALASIRGQVGIKTEIIVVDDASTDGTADYLALQDDVTTIVHEHAIQQRLARNCGAALATSKLLAFCDDDDLWAPRKLYHQVEHLRLSNCRWCTVNAIHVDDKLRPIGVGRLRDPKDLKWRLPLGNIVPGGCSGVLMERDLFNTVGGFDDKRKYVEDWVLWLRLLELGGPPACIDEVLLAYRVWAGSFSHSGLRAQREAIENVVREFSEHRGGAARANDVVAFEVRQRVRNEGRLTLAREIGTFLRDAKGLERLRVVGAVSVPHRIYGAVPWVSLGPRDVIAAKRWMKAFR